jgi:hypothetical protein
MQRLVLYFCLMRSLILLLFLAISHGSFAQLGGSGTYAFLNTPPSARVLAMGGMVNAIIDRDPSLIHQNPALFNPQMDRRIVLNYIDYVGNIKAGYGGYVHRLKSGRRYLGAGFYYADYGTMDGYDAGGNATGPVKAAENCVAFSYGGALGSKLQFGATAKFAYSIMGPYIGNGPALDAGLIYRNERDDYQVAFVVRNLGFQLVRYGNNKPEPLASDVQIGFSKKLEHMPLRFHVVAHNLHRPDITYRQFLPNRSLLNLNGDDEDAKENTLGDKVLRHLVLGGEFLLSKNWGVMFGYNHLRRREMLNDARRGMAGFSWGMTFKVERFQLTYGSGTMFPGYNMNHFTFSFKPGDFKKKTAVKSTLP